MIPNYYIYFYVDPTSPNIPFYVGKGRNGRFRDASQKQRNKHLYNKIKKLRSSGYDMKDITIFPFTGLTNEDALKKEVELIALYGRKDQGKGPLLNYTDGGDGVRGITPNPMLNPYRDRVIQLYEEGNTLREIANEFGCVSVIPVQYLLKLNNIPRRRVGRRSKQ